MATTFGTPTICPPVNSASEMPRSNIHANGNARETHYPAEIVGVLSNQRQQPGSHLHQSLSSVIAHQNRP